jgi:hypothetical protein
MAWTCIVFVFSFIMQMSDLLYVTQELGNGFKQVATQFGAHDFWEASSHDCSLPVRLLPLIP